MQSGNPRPGRVWTVAYDRGYQTICWREPGHVPKWINKKVWCSHRLGRSIRKKDELFYTLIEDVKPIPGALPFVRALKEAGFKLGMATSSQERLVQLIVKKFNLEPLFDTVVCTIDITHSKPHPEIFLKTADRLHFDPVDCAVVEDSINGVEAAKAAGMYTIGLTTSFARSQLSKADCIIDSFAELNVDKIQSMTTDVVEEPFDCVDVC